MISTLLFVTNNFKEHNALKSCLKRVKENVYLIPAHSYADALRVLKLVKPDAILLDQDLYDKESHQALIQFIRSENSDIIPVHVIGRKKSNTIISQEATAIGNDLTIDEVYENVLSKIINA